MPRWLWVVLLGLVAALVWSGRGGAPPALVRSASAGAISCPMPPRFTDAGQPLQSGLDGRVQPFELDGARVSPLAGFSLQARVLGREDYQLGRTARFSPTDLALGWGPMSEPGLAERLNVSQGGRWYRYRWGGEGPPMAPDAIARNSANMHMVPVDAGVARRLAQVRAGDVVRVHGWLVAIDAPDGWHWRSSLSRDDSGDGACELVLVCAIEE